MDMFMSKERLMQMECFMATAIAAWVIWEIIFYIVRKDMKSNIMIENKKAMKNDIMQAAITMDTNIIIHRQKVHLFVAVGVGNTLNL